MKRTFTVIFRSLSFLFACFFGLTSCMEDAYDMNGGIDMTMQLGGDSLYLPVGSTQEFTIKTLLGEDMLNGVLRVNAEGVYVLSPDIQTTEMTLAAIEVEPLQIDDIVVDTLFDLEVESQKSGAFARKGNVPMERSIVINFSFDDLPQEIKELDRMSFAGTSMTLQFSFPDLPADLSLSQMTPDIYVTMPEEFSFASPAVDGQNRIHVTEFNTSSGYEVTMPLAAMFLENIHVEANQMRFVLPVLFDGNIAIEENPASKSLSVDELGMSVRCEVNQINPQVVKGIFSPVIDEQFMDLAFGEIPDVLRMPGTVLDFAQPHIHLQIVSNTGVPVKAELEILPIVNGQEMSDRRQILDVEIPAAEEEERTINYWVAGDTKTMPQGYTFLQADVAGLLRQIPDILHVAIRAAADTMQVHTYDFEKIYSASASFVPEVPLVFGEELSVVFSDTMTDLPATIADQIAGKDVTLYGEIYNRFPLEFYMELEALDENLQPLPIQMSEPQLVKAGDGSHEMSSRLDFRIADPEYILKEKTLSAFRIVCKAASNSEVAGIPVTEAASFRADLKLKLTGGIIVNPSSEDEDDVSGSGGDNQPVIDPDDNQMPAGQNK